jgi:hypothetical protein
MSSPRDASTDPNNGRTLLLIIALFLLPVVIALTMYWFSVRPDAAHYGDLIDPPRPLHFPPMLTWQNKPFSETELRGKWSLLYVAPTPCSEQCVAQIYLIRQIHAALGKEKGRVQRILLTAKNPEGVWLDAIQRDYPELIILVRPLEAATQIAAQLAVPGKAGSGIYLIDPQGNAMMHYAPGVSPGGLHKDLLQLLKYSWAG